MKPEQEVTEAKPLTMEVSMIAIPAPKQPIAEPPKPAPPPVEKKPPVPKKPPTPPKPVVQKTKPPAPKPVPVSDEPAEFAPFKPSEPVAAPAQASPPPSAASSSSSSSSQSSTTAQTFTEANFRANYAHNPKPEYPAVARGRGWQGKVLLRVKVSAEGLSDDVSVEQSSGHDILDESAVEAVKKWRFIPAKRGDTPVASSVIVPIDFKLRN
jgi:protein TonB